MELFLSGLSSKMGVKLQQAHLAGTNLTGARLERASLEYANLGGANLAGAYLQDANMANAKLTGARLERAFMEGAHLEGANLIGANSSKWSHLEGAIFTSATMPDGKIYDPEIHTVEKLTGRHIEVSGG